MVRDFPLSFSQSEAKGNESLQFFGENERNEDRYFIQVVSLKHLITEIHKTLTFAPRRATEQRQQIGIWGGTEVKRSSGLQLAMRRGVRGEVSEEHQWVMGQINEG